MDLDLDIAWNFGRDGAVKHDFNVLHVIAQWNADWLLVLTFGELTEEIGKNPLKMNTTFVFFFFLYGKRRDALKSISS